MTEKKGSQQELDMEQIVEQVRRLILSLPEQQRGQAWAYVVTQMLAEIEPAHRLLLLEVVRQLTVQNALAEGPADDGSEKGNSRDDDGVIYIG